MQCPVDQTQLVMTERQGVEIDYCPSCRGIWLDRGELDKIIDRAAGTVAGERAAPAAPAVAPVYGTPDPRAYDAREERPRYVERDDRGYERGYDDRRRDDHRGYERGDDGRKRKKRESWLEDLFDF